MNAYIGQCYMDLWFIGMKKRGSKILCTFIDRRSESYHEIGLVEVDRNTKYYSFNNLAKIDKVRNNNNGLSPTGKNYYVYVEAEDKNGKIISKTDNVCAVVETFSNTYNGTLIVSR